ncbi:Phospholipase/carboxylesterase [Candidatus Terasakiella magnetica]|uniref:Phospholipase/carboxylesterase n=1 Tax=Candidatus Terasakiella magnetica TaxID=1867952 RepID=A0A1C3RLB1_9PROT|nr:dienelactone hydrolase family protein [Candidatus Terasakiella magnetica]SCA58041.1 Phospholipase/carboxylesterase [Candidatus Terasakiella magnetica]
MVELQGPDLIPQNEKVTSLVVLLHGFGADGQDLIGLAPFFVQHLPNTAFHAPDGPQVCEMSPFGRQWFSLARCDSDFLRRRAETQDIAFEAMYDGACEAAAPIQHYVDGLMKRYGLSADKVALVGFSQGTMMSLHLGLRQESPYSCIVGFSGALVGASKLKADKKCDSPVLLVHGEADEMLPIHAVELAQSGLKACDIDAQVIRRPGLPHSIDEAGAMACAEFLKQHLEG